MKYEYHIFWFSINISHAKGYNKMNNIFPYLIQHKKEWTTL